MRNKAQTAMEYLMTYGWAILIIIVVVAALYAMGVFKLGGAVTCSPCFSYFAFVDYNQGTAAANDGTLMIRNGARTITGLTSDVGTASACTGINECDPGTDISFTAFTDTGDVTVTITYTDADSGLSHTDTAKIHNP